MAKKKAPAKPTKGRTAKKLPRPSFAVAKKKVDSLKKIKNVKEYQQVSTMFDDVVNKIRKAEESKTYELDPINEAKKRITERWDTLIKQGEALRDAIRPVLLAWVEKQTEKTDLANTKLEAGKLSVNQHQKLVSTLGTSFGGVSTASVSKLVIDDEKKIPREYMVPDKVAITKALRAGTQIDGCRLEKEKTLKVAKK